MTVYVVLEHQIHDFDTLKQVYSDDAERRRRMGCVGGRIWRGVDDPNQVSVVMEWDTAEHAREFAGSFELEQAMHWATVKAPTTRVIVYEEAHTSAH
jgi:heme-degrading monooxygenase HmoA